MVERLNFIRFWASHMKNVSNEKWSKEHSDFINSIEIIQKFRDTQLLAIVWLCITGLYLYMDYSTGRSGHVKPTASLRRCS